MLSLSPRYDLFRFQFPKDFLPQHIEEKYAKILNRNAGVIMTPIDYLNESIQGVNMPGVENVTMTQNQISHNIRSYASEQRPVRGLGRINVEPNHENTTISPINPLAAIQHEFKVTFRQNQGLLNYYMLYETLMYKTNKGELPLYDDILTLFILNEQGVAVSRVDYLQCYMSGIEGLEFSYNKTDRQTETFDVTFQFNNIDFNIIDNISTGNEIPS